MNIALACSLGSLYSHGTVQLVVRRACVTAGPKACFGGLNFHLKYSLS